MKKSIKTICLLAILAITSVNIVNAQLGVQIGYVNAKFYSDVPLFPAGLDNYNGLEVGPTYDQLIMGGLFMHYGLLYTYGTNSEKVGLVNVENTAHYLNIPVRLGYRHPISGKVSIFGYAGPNFTFGLAGKTSREIVGLTRNGKWYGEDSKLKRFDIKLGIGLGIQISNCILKGGYDWGLINAYDSDDFYARRNQFNISAAYQF